LDRHRTVPESRRTAQRTPQPDDEALVHMGLRAGEVVRWRSSPGARWQTGVIARRERDGSIGVTDRRGMARSLPVDRLEVGCVGGRGAPGWEPLAVRAARSEQLRLL
jgi:hypothetical protein